MEFDRFRTFTNQALLSRYKQSARARKKKKNEITKLEIEVSSGFTKYRFVVRRAQDKKKKEAEEK